MNELADLFLIIAVSVTFFAVVILILGFKAKQRTEKTIASWSDEKLKKAEKSLIKLPVNRGYIMAANRIRQEILRRGL